MNSEARAALKQVLADTTTALEYTKSRRAQLARDLADVEAMRDLQQAKVDALTAALDESGTA